MVVGVMRILVLIKFSNVKFISVKIGDPITCKVSYRSMGTTGDPVTVRSPGWTGSPLHRLEPVPVNHFTG